jgi:hypothetical protein
MLAGGVSVCVDRPGPTTANKAGVRVLWRTREKARERALPRCRRVCSHIYNQSGAFALTTALYSTAYRPISYAHRGVESYRTPQNPRGHVVYFEMEWNDTSRNIGGVVVRVPPAAPAVRAPAPVVRAGGLWASLRDEQLSRENTMRLQACEIESQARELHEARGPRACVRTCVRACM